MRLLSFTVCLAAFMAAACSQPGERGPGDSATGAPTTSGTGVPSIEPTGSMAPTVDNPPPLPTSTAPSTLPAISRPPFEAFSCDPVDTTPYPRRLRRLTPRQYANTLVDLFNGRRAGAAPLPETCPGEYDLMAPGQGPPCLPQNVRVPLQDTQKVFRFSTFSDGLGVSDYEFRLSMADTAATSAALVQSVKSGTCWGNDGGGANFASCVDTLVQEKGSVLFRRPLSPEEVAKYGGYAKDNEAALGRDEALALAFQTLLVSPQFVFQPEIGADIAPNVSRLTAYELAAAMASTLTGRPPDAELWAAAAANALGTPEQIRAQITRILGTPGGQGGREFVMEYFDLRHLVDVRKEEDKFLGCREYQKLRIVYEAELVAGDIFASNSTNNFLSTLLTSTVQYYDCSNEMIYGFSDGGSEWPEIPNSKRVLAPANQRAGLLTHPAFLGGHAGLSDTKPVSRGRFVSESLLCRPVPAVNLTEVPPLPTDPNMTMREKLLVHSQGACAACHSLMDSMGLAFEMYDSVGRYRTTQGEDNPKPIDPTGVISGAGDADGTFADAVAMSQHLATSQTVEQCFMRHGFKYFMGRTEDKFDQCTLFNAQKAYADGGGNFVDYLGTLFTSDSFLNRSY
jgi:hypothetical protein